MSSKSNKVMCICRFCGHNFYIFRSVFMKNGGGKFCSRKCRYSQPSIVVSGSNNCIRKSFELGARALSDGVPVNRDGIPLRVSIHNKTAYMQFTHPGCRSPIPLHRFIAYQIYGEIALEAECVRHLNDDRWDNSFTNIVYGTVTQNLLDIPFQKRKEMGRHRNMGRRRFSPEQVREIKLSLDSGSKILHLAKKYNCGLGSIANIIDGITYQDLI